MPRSARKESNKSKLKSSQWLTLLIYILCFTISLQFYPFGFLQSVTPLEFEALQGVGLFCFTSCTLSHTKLSPVLEFIYIYALFTVFTEYKLDILANHLKTMYWFVSFLQMVKYIFSHCKAFQLIQITLYNLVSSNSRLR